MARPAGVADPHVAEQILSDYVNFAPILIDRAPVARRPAAATHISAVAAYLSQFVAARVDPHRADPRDGRPRPGRAAPR